MKLNGIIKKISRVIDALVCVLLIIITISKGGFYKEDIIFPVVIISILGLVYAIIKVILNIRENGIIKKSKLITVMDTFMIILPISYFLPVIFKKYFSMENALFEAIRYTNMSIVYFIVRTSNHRKLYYDILLVLACIVGVLGIDEITYRVMEGINSPIGYLPRNLSVVSSVVQYANIAAIIMLLGVSVAIYYELNNSKLIYKLINIFLQTLIMLTSSRMGLILLLFTNVIFTIYCIKQKERYGNVLFNLDIAIIMSGVISNLVENGQYSGVYITLAALFVIVCVLKFIEVYLNKFIEKIKINKTIKIYVTIFICATLLLIFTIPSNLKITSDKEQIRKVSEFEIGTNELYLKVNKNMQDTSFTILVNQIYEDYKPEQVLKITEKDFSGNVLKTNFKTSNGCKFVEFVYKVNTGEVTFEDIKINNKDIVMSYALLPDRLAFRFKGADFFDLNNKLRMEYYLDALKLISNSVLIGNGGEGFKFGYQMVQNSSYISSEVHSAPLQITVESGMIGGISYLFINCIAIVILVITYKNSKEKCFAISLICMLLCINIMSLFDLTMSFAIMSYVFAVILGLIVNRYIEQPIPKDKFLLDNKSGKSMIQLGIMSGIILGLIVINIYIINVYRGSLISLPKIDTESEENLENNIFSKMILLEKKLKLDKYNINYMTELNNTYYDYIEILKDRVIGTEENETEQEDLAKYILKQKENIDNMIEYEYYNKYAIEQVSSCYFTNYIRYADILDKNFESTEVAYSFFLNYALKLNERLLEIGKNNKVANNMYKNILQVHIQNLKNQNKYIQSVSIQTIINEMQQLIDKTENI